MTARGALAADAVTTDADPSKWVDLSVTRLQRALAVDELHKVLGPGVTSAGLAALQSEMREAYDALNAPITEQLERITTNAAALPGSTDAEASVRAGTPDELAHVLDGLARLGVMTAGLPKLASQLKDARYLAYFVDVPEVDIARVHSFGAEPVNPSATRGAIVQVVHDVTGLPKCRGQPMQSASHTLDQVLVAVARGEYSPLRLRFAGSHSETSSRFRRMQLAMTEQIVAGEHERRIAS